MRPEQRLISGPVPSFEAVQRPRGLSPVNPDPVGLAPCPAPKE